MKTSLRRRWLSLLLALSLALALAPGALAADPQSRRSGQCDGQQRREQRRLCLVL